ncbi:MAG TPA: ATP-binding protein [Acidimicrobiia bacterium]|nr:ATP-binding protein [Acidimicrobiia bacterium]
MDTITVVAFGIAGLGLLAAIGLWVRSRRYARAIDSAIDRIGGGATGRNRFRAAVLEGTFDRLERSTAQAQRERSRLAGAIQLAPLGVLLTDDHGVVITTNAAAERFLGTRLGEAVAQVRVRDTIERAVLDRTSVAVEVELYTPVRAVLEVSAVPLDFGVESLGAVAFIEDVTEARRVTAMRRDFIANASHELKTPLAALAALAEALAGTVTGDPAAERLAGRLRSEAERLARLVGDILDLSQAEALTPHDEPVELAGVVEAVVREMEPIANAAGIGLVATPVPAGGRVAGDSRQLRSMLSNLVDNAIKYSFPEEGRPTPTVTITTTVSDETVSLAVADQGIGIAESHQDRIFERFYRVDRARSRETGGTGLGLSIARHIARNHRGDIAVRSREGEGATFTVTLPRWSPR